MATRKQNLTELLVWTMITAALVAVLAACFGVNVRIMEDKSISDAAALLAIVPTSGLAGLFIQRQWAWGVRIWNNFKYE